MASDHKVFGLPDKFERVVEPCAKLARDFVQNEEGVVTFAIVGNDKEPPDIDLILGKIFNEISKEDFAEQIRARAVQRNAKFVLFVAESWMLKAPKQYKTHKEVLTFVEYIKSKYGSIGNSPYREECMTFLLQTYEGSWNAVATMEKFSKGKTFGDVHFVRNTAKEDGHDPGRFGDLLPPRPSERTR